MEVRAQLGWRARQPPRAARGRWQSDWATAARGPPIQGERLAPQNRLATLSDFEDVVLVRLAQVAGVQQRADQALPLGSGAVAADAVGRQLVVTVAQDA